MEEKYVLAGIPIQRRGYICPCCNRIVFDEARTAEATLSEAEKSLPCDVQMQVNNSEFQKKVSCAMASALDMSCSSSAHSQTYGMMCFDEKYAQQIHDIIDLGYTLILSQSDPSNIFMPRKDTDSIALMFICGKVGIGNIIRITNAANSLIHDQVFSLYHTNNHKKSPTYRMSAILSIFQTETHSIKENLIYLASNLPRIPDEERAYSNVISYLEEYYAKMMEEK